jgi:hypothetical protein
MLPIELCKVNSYLVQWGLHKKTPKDYLGRHLGTYLDYGIPKDYLKGYT